MYYESTRSRYTTGICSRKNFFVVIQKEELMEILSVVQLADVNGKPSVKISALPSPLRVGDPLTLKFRIERTSHGRLELLVVDGEFRVTSVKFDASSLPRKQLLSVESVGKPPTWTSSKKRAEKRPLAPAKSPPFIPS